MFAIISNVAITIIVYEILESIEQIPLGTHLGVKWMGFKAHGQLY